MGPAHRASPSSQWATTWQSSWDRLEEACIPDREAMLSALVDVVEALPESSCTVVDLACGTGSVTRRLLTRVPHARVVALDVDPVLLTIASATFAGDGRVRVVRADLRDQQWVTAVAREQVDAVLTATALHWLSERVVRRLYRELATLVRPGGVFAHLERMPLAELPRLGRMLAERASRSSRPEHQTRADWDAWWDAAANDPVLRAQVMARRGVFEDNYPAEEFSPPAAWHLDTLHEAGFAEAGVVWRAGSSAIVAAVR